jgi:ABC-2 type transport system permease protein
MFKLFLSHALRQIANFFKTQKLARTITVLMFFGIFLLIAVGLYFFFLEGFSYIKSEAYFSKALSLMVYEIFFLGISSLVFASATITSLFGLFRNDAAPWLMATPRFKTLLYYISARIFLSSLWPMVIVALPGLLAIRKISHLSSGEFWFMVISIISLSLFAVIMAVLLLMIVAKFLCTAEKLSGKKLLKLKNIVICIVIVFVLLSASALQFMSHIDAFAIFQPENISAASSNLNGLVSKFSFFPSHLTAITLLNLEENQFVSGLLSNSQLFLELFLVLILLKVFSAWYLELWQRLQEGQLEASPAVPGKTGSARIFPRYLSGAQGAIFEKEAVSMFRNGKNVLWICFTLFLWALQVSANVFLHKKFFHQQPLLHQDIPLFTQALQVILIIYFTNALVLRFSFPSFSIERKTLWIIASAPVNMVKLFWAKLSYFTILFIIIGFIFAFVNSLLLSIPFLGALLFLLVVIIAIVTVSILGFCLGVIFPNFEIDDPEFLSTSLPGLLFVGVSLVYGGLGTFAFYEIIKYGIFSFFILFAVVSFLISILSINWALRKLSRFEFTKI